jgi:hypothetical protein
VLTAATLALLGYALSTVGWSMLDLFWWSRLEVWADLVTAVFGLLLVPAAVLIRTSIPGGLPLACAALLGLQGINLHNSMHVHGDIQVWTEGGRAVFAAWLMMLAMIGQRREAAARREEQPDEGRG